MGRREPPPEVDPFDPTDFIDLSAAATEQAEQTLRYELGPGAMVGDYRIEGKIGEGGMGVVYAAVHPLIGKRAAIKVLQRELCTDRTALARFVDEARVVNKIGHPNIVDIFTLGQLPDGRSYLVMEWLAGEPLRSRLARGCPDLDETCYILRSLVRALDAAHEKGVVHRDLKPDNVFLVAVRGDRPMVKLLDFGIAKLVHADHRLERTASNQMIGTPLYIAPEQARADTIDHRADIYALGAMAFEMVCGRPPFDGKSAMEVIAKHMMEPPVRPSARVQGLPVELDDIIYAMLAKEPNSRPKLADFARVLDHVTAALVRQPVALRGSMPVIDRVAPTIGTDGPPAIGDRPGAATASPVVSQQWTPQAAAMTAGAPPALALSSPSYALPEPRGRRWWMPALIGAACLAGGIAITAVVMRDRGAPVIESKPAVDTSGGSDRSTDNPAKPAENGTKPAAADSGSKPADVTDSKPPPTETAEPQVATEQKPTESAGPATEAKPAKAVATKPAKPPRRPAKPRTPTRDPDDDIDTLMAPGSLGKGPR